MMKILHLADTHYDQNTENLHYPASKEMVLSLFEWLKENKNSYDLIMISGDITVKGTAFISELQYVKEKFDALSVPYIIIPGNHDLCPLKEMEKRYPGIEEYEYTSLENTNFFQVFGEKGVRFSQVINQVHFIGFSIRNGDPDGTLSWLRKELETPYEKIVIGHYPLIPTRLDGFCSTWDYFRIENSLGDLKNLIFDETHHVKAYFCGHQHVNSIVKVNRGFHIETASAVLGSCSYREILIDNEKIDISTHFFIGENDWVGVLVSSETSHDVLHGDPYSYQRGNQNDLYLYIERESP
ncbi:MAG: metallophosphoesterase [Clostridia bacterium]|nr:metallophosphoesterase [Clostridia bacterium]